MTNKKLPSRSELAKLLEQLEQAPNKPEPADQDQGHFSPWNVSMKNPKVKRTLAFSLTEEEKK